MHSLLKNHFEVQTGMYFDYFTTYGNWMISMSNIIEDSFWNYAVIPTFGLYILFIKAWI